MTAIYTPEDTDNYQTVAVEITVNVLPAGLPVWAVVLIVLGCAAVVAVVIVLIVRGKKSRHNIEKETESLNAGGSVLLSKMQTEKTAENSRKNL